jgi:uncharacterized protein YecE (DUF72 family)
MDGAPPGWDLRPFHVGISGWRYPPWRGVFYPSGLAQQRELQYASRVLASIELNGSFYALQRPGSYQKWRTRTPAGFVFSVRGPRFVTHLKKLAEVEVPLANFFASGVLALGDQLGPVLWQLPPTLGFDANRPLRHALEVRHPSFETAELVQLLRDNDIALVCADSAGKWPVLDDVTSDFVYIRLHGDPGSALTHLTQAHLGQLNPVGPQVRRPVGSLIRTASGPPRPGPAPRPDRAAPGPRARTGWESS